MQVLFLDIDGTICSDDYWDNLNPQPPQTQVVVEPAKIQMINQLVSEFDLTVILSSHRRYHHSIQEIQGICDAAGATFTIQDTTPLFDYDKIQREAEIWAYLDLHPEITQSIVLDDDYQFTGKIDSFISICSSETGVTEVNIKQICEYLEKV